MSEIKAIEKEHFQKSVDNESVITSLNKISDGEWKLLVKYESRSEIYELPNSDLFVEVTFSRAGNYHQGYEYFKPTFSIVNKNIHTKTVFTEIKELESKAYELKFKYFDKHDETKLIPDITTGWQYEHKMSYFDSIYSIDGYLLKQTLCGNSDWTELVLYSIVEKEDKTIIKYNKIKK